MCYVISSINWVSDGEWNCLTLYLTKAGDPARATQATVCARPKVAPRASFEGAAFFIRITFKLEVCNREIVRGLGRLRNRLYTYE